MKQLLIDQVAISLKFKIWAALKILNMWNPGKGLYTSQQVPH